MPTLLITGAGRGLGLEFVRQYAADGWHVIATCRDPAKADELQKIAAKHADIRVEMLDVVDEKSIAALAERLKDISIDLLINNAGIYSGALHPLTQKNKMDGQGFGSIDAEAWLRVFHANTIAPILVLQAFMPHLLRGTGRKLVNITSKMGSIELMGEKSIAYRTSKAALNAAMCSIAHDLETKRIAWVNLHPGWVKTDMGGPNADLTPEVSVAGMRKVIENLSLKNSGRFLSYDGKIIPW